MKFDNCSKLEEVVWNSRIADLPRGENRAILNRCFNGEPPFDPATAEEDGIQVNRNFLHGTKKLTEARGQWNTAFLAPGKYFNVSLDSGEPAKRSQWSQTITRHINKQLKASRKMSAQIRATGATVLLHGPGPVLWADKRNPVPGPIPISSLLIPSETDSDFDNLEWFSVFREWTPAQLYNMTHGFKVDPGWNLPLVMQQLRQAADDTFKQPNATAYQYMPERIEELIKQDMGYWGSDAVATVDCWDCYFREAEDGEGWYRRIFLDWGVTPEAYRTTKVPDSKGKLAAKKDPCFLYSSGDRKYADSLSQILHCQHGDCSCVAPFKYHSERSLGWMIWGICDLLNRLHCKFTESTFEQMLWFFRVAGQSDFQRVKKAMFENMGTIPNGVSFVTAQERFKPDQAMLEMAFDSMETILAENSAAFSSDGDRLGGDKERTATETMALMNSTSSLTTGVLTLAYDNQTPQYREICRRFCAKNSPYKMVRDFRVNCIKDGVPAEMLDVERWEVTPERIMGGGSKTVQMAQTNGLIGIRKYLNPEGQRYVDHQALTTYTDDPAVASKYAALDGGKEISNSTHDASLATDRILRGLQFQAMPTMIYEDYVAQWLSDMAQTIQRIQQTGNHATVLDLLGLQNLAKHIEEFLEVMAKNDEEKPRVKIFKDALAKMMNAVKAWAGQLKQQMEKAQQQNGNGQIDPADKAKIAGKLLIDKAKADNLRESHAQKTAQRQVQFEMEEQRKERRHHVEQRHAGARLGAELASNHLRTLQGQ